MHFHNCGSEEVTSNPRPWATIIRPVRATSQVKYEVEECLVQRIILRIAPTGELNAARSSLSASVWKTCYFLQSTNLLALNESKLGSLFHLLQARLTTSSDDPYSWSYEPELKHLSSRQITNTQLSRIKSFSGGLAQVSKQYRLVELALSKRRVVWRDSRSCSKTTRTWNGTTLGYHRRADAGKGRQQSFRLKLSVDNQLAVVRGELASADATIQDLRQQVGNLRQQENPRETLPRRSKSVPTSLFSDWTMLSGQWKVFDGSFVGWQRIAICLEFYSMTSSCILHRILDKGLQRGLAIATLNPGGGCLVVGLDRSRLY